MKSFRKTIYSALSIILIFSTVINVVTAESQSSKEELFKKLGYTDKQISTIKSQPEVLNDSLSQYKNNDILKFMELGFTLKEISDFTDSDLNYLKNKSGELVDVSQKYYRIENGDAFELDKETALKEVRLHKEKIENDDQISLLNSEIGSDTETTSWMIMTTSVVKDTSQSPTAYYYKNSFEWLTEPVWVLTDAIGISHRDNVTQIQNSEYFKYTYDRYTNDTSSSYIDTTSTYYWTADDKNANGMAFKYDLLGSDYINGNKVIVRNHRGYMIFGVTRSNSNEISSAVYGHYTHTELGAIGVSASISLKSLSVSGALSKTEMTDTGVSYNF